MLLWAMLLILSVAGMFIILLRRLPVAIKTAVGDVRQETVKSLVIALTEPSTEAVIPLTESAMVEAANPEDKPPPMALRLSSADIPDLEAKAEEAFRQRDFTTARGNYETLLTIDNRQPKWFNRLGIICLELEEFRAARDAFRQALNFDPRVASRHVNLAMAEFALGHRVTAISHLRKAIALAPNVKRYHDLLEDMG